jgi:hypothetical protein
MFMYICWFHNHIKSSTDVPFYFNPTIAILVLQPNIFDTAVY